jgi:hypothetical protein
METNQVTKAHLSPLDQSLMGRPRAKQPYPDAKIVREQQMRRVDALPLDYTPGAIKGDGPGAREATAALNQLAGTWHSIQDAAKDNPFEKLAPAARRSFNSVEERLRSAATTIAAQVGHYQRQIDERIMPRVDPALGAEIRAHLRGKPIMELVNAAKADARVSSALLAAPAVLVDLKADHVALIRKNAMKAHAPEQTALLEETVAAGERISKAQDHMITLASKIVAWEIEAKEPDSLAALRQQP